MTTNGVHILSDPGIAAQRHRLEELLDSTAVILQQNGIAGFFDPVMEAYLRGVFAMIGAHEGTLWLLTPEEDFLRPRFNTGPAAEKMLRDVKQDVSKGIISMVLAMGITSHSDRVYEEAKHDKTVDRTVGSITCSMVAVPFSFAGNRRGVISAVTLKPSVDDPNPPSIPPSAASTLGAAAVLLGRLFDHRLYGILSGEIGN